MILAENGLSVRPRVSSIESASISGGMLPAARDAKPPMLQTVDTSWGSEIQVIAPHMMGKSQPRNSWPVFHILSSLGVDATGS